MLVAIDTQTLVFMVRRVGSNEQLARAAMLAKELDARSADVMIPSVVLAEYYCG